MLQQPKKINKRARIREYLESIFYLDLPKKGRASQQFISEYLDISVGMVNLVLAEMRAERKAEKKLKNSKKKEKDSISEKPPTPPPKKQIISHAEDSHAVDRIQQLENQVNTLLARTKTVPSLPEFEAWLKDKTHLPEGAYLYRRISSDGTKHGDRKAAGEVRKTLDMLRVYFNE